MAEKSFMESASSDEKVKLEVLLEAYKAFKDEILKIIADAEKAGVIEQCI